MHRLDSHLAALIAALALVAGTFVAPPVGEAQVPADATRLTAPAQDHELRAVAWTIISILGIAGSIYPIADGIYELARPDQECAERSPAGACIQTRSPTSDDRILGGLSAGLGLVELVGGIVFALLADDELHQLARARATASLEVTPWASLDGHGGAAGVVLRW